MRKYKDPWWVIAEKRAALFFGGSLVTGSGRGYLKSDVTQTEIINGRKVLKQGGFRVEVKSSQAETISFETEWLLKIIIEAKQYKQHPAFFILLSDNVGFAFYPVDLEEEKEQPSESNTLVIDSKTKTLSSALLRKFTFIRLNPSILSAAQVPRDCMYIWWKIEEEK